MIPVIKFGNGNLTEVREEQPAKTPTPGYFNESGRMIEVKPESLKA